MARVRWPGWARPVIWGWWRRWCCWRSSGLVTVPENFATTSNLVSILSLAATIGVITVGMTFVIIGGGIDLSVGALMALASVWATTLATQAYGAGRS